MERNEKSRNAMTESDEVTVVKVDAKQGNPRCLKIGRPLWQLRLHRVR